MNRFTPVLRAMCDSATCIGSINMVLDAGCPPSKAYMAHQRLNVALNDPYAIDATEWFDMVRLFAGFLAAMTNEELQDFWSAL